MSEGLGDAESMDVGDIRCGAHADGVPAQHDESPQALGVGRAVDAVVICPVALLTELLG